MKRAEAVALLKELGEEHLIQPSLVSIEQRKPDGFELCIKGFYDLELITAFIRKFDLTVKEDKTKGYLCIFKP